MGQQVVEDFLIKSKNDEDEAGETLKKLLDPARGLQIRKISLVVARNLVVEY